MSKHHSKNRSRLVGGLIVGGVILGLSYLGFVVLPGFSSGEATLVLAFENNGQGRAFTGEVVRRMTIFDALLASSDAGNIEIKYEIDPSGKIKITELNSFTKELEKKNLVFYLNNKKIDEDSIARVEIHPGDTIEVQLQ
jgi:hypothetical protein